MPILLDHLDAQQCVTVVREAAREELEDVPFLVIARRGGWELKNPFSGEQYFARYDWQTLEFIFEKGHLLEPRKPVSIGQDDD